MSNWPKKTVTKSWFGKPPLICYGCKGRIKTSFSDIKTFRGPWGCFCDDCVPKWSWSSSTTFYGEGLGQRYEKQGTVWIKTQG